MSRPNLTHELLPMAMVLASWGLAAYYWPHLPDPVPTHWGIDGLPNGWMPRPWGAAVGPLLTSGLYALFCFLPRLDPRLQRQPSSPEIVGVLKGITTAFGAFVTYMVLSTAASGQPRLPVGLMWVGLGLMFAVLGNYMPKLRSNFLMGIRTPWTLSSDEVWYQTHRVGGRIMVLGGLVMMIAAALPAVWATGVAIAALVVTAVVPVVYSYWLYQREPHPPAA